MKRKDNEWTSQRSSGKDYKVLMDFHENKSEDDEYGSYKDELSVVFHEKLIFLFKDSV